MQTDTVSFVLQLLSLVGYLAHIKYSYNICGRNKGKKERRKEKESNKEREKKAGRKKIYNVR